MVDGAVDLSWKFNAGLNLNLYCPKSNVSPGRVIDQLFMLKGSPGMLRGKIVSIKVNFCPGPDRFAPYLS